MTRENRLAALTVASGVAFVWLAVAVLLGLTRPIDEWALRALRGPAGLHDPIGPPWFESAARDVTALGSFAVLAGATLAASGFMIVSRSYRALAFTVAAALGGLAIGHALKTWFDVPRPDVVPHLTPVRDQSFPSGHSLNAAVIYLALGLAVGEALRSRRQKAYVLGVAVGAAVLVGLSRVYLGVHHPSDVLAGWLVGAAWVSACRLAELRWREPDDNPSVAGT